MDLFLQMGVPTHVWRTKINILRVHQLYNNNDKKQKKIVFSPLFNLLEVKDLLKDQENLYHVNEQGMGFPSPSTCQQNLIKREIGSHYFPFQLCLTSYRVGSLPWR